jgi:ARG and Rhodanese-Phosphatase-superfamily-associated Protein domain
MLRVMLGIAGLSLAASLAVVVGSQSRAEDQPAAAAAPPPPETFGVGPYTLVGPFVHKNLAIYLVTPSDAAKPAEGGKKYLTLQEAMEKKVVKVNETGSVNELTVQNAEEPDVYIQSGDIVKGGRQDRTLGSDYILAKSMGTCPIASFCVEHGRWTQRGGESAQQFASADFAITGVTMKLAANTASTQASQGKVWDEVAALQEKASTYAGVRVQSTTSPSSLQLALENADLNKRLDGYIDALSKTIEGRDDVTGMAFAINGKMNSADVYADAELFRKMWPKLLRSAATEAFSELPGDTDHDPTRRLGPTHDEIAACIAGADAAKADEHRINDRTRVVRRENEKSVAFETIDTATNAWVHRAYLVPPPKAPERGMPDTREQRPQQQQEQQQQQQQQEQEQQLRQEALPRPQ